MDPVSCLSRQFRKGLHNKKLSFSQEMVVAGWVVARTHSHQPTRTRDLYDFIHLAFGIDVSPTWVTNFQHRNYLTSRLPSKMLIHEGDQDIIAVGANFIRKVRDLDLNDDQIVVIDKCKFYSDARYVRHLCPKGWYSIFLVSIYFNRICSDRPRKPTPARGFPDTVYTILVANGTLAPIYIESKEKFSNHLQLPKNEGHIEYLPPKGVKRRGEHGVIACMEYQKSVKTFSKGDILISDAEAAFDTEDVRDFLASMGVTKLTFPKGLGHLMNPCDNEFHAEVKKRYYQLLAGLQTSTTKLDKETKFNFIKDAYYGGSEASIVSYFKLTGILGDEEPEHVMQRLLNLGVSLEGTESEIHQSQADAYVSWCKDQ